MSNLSVISYDFTKSISVIIFATLIAIFSSCHGYPGNRRPHSKLKSHVRGQTSSDEGLLQPRIVGGEPAKFGDVPYQMVLHINESPISERICGAALMDYCGLKYLLTAAHCLWEGPKLGQLVPLRKVHIVGADLNLDNYNPREQWFQARFQIIHEDYDPRYTLNDIAIIMLDRYAYESLGMEPIDLPEPGWDDPEYVVVSGWGSDHFGGPVLSELQKIEVPVMDWHICKQLQFVDGKFLGPKMFCMGNTDYKNLKGPCKGDSGGPVVGYNYTLQKWYLAGLVSFGGTFICGNPFSASVATRVTNYIDWIEGLVKPWLEKYGTGNPFHNTSHCTNET